MPIYIDQILSIIKIDSIISGCKYTLNNFIIKNEMLLPNLTKSNGWENKRSGWEKLGPSNPYYETRTRHD